jgi:hemerythrin-like domain-containing protein
MRIKKALQADQDTIARFMAVLGNGLTVASQSKLATPGFFVFAGQFIHEFIERVYLRKEDLLLDALVECGFARDQGPVGNMHLEHQRSRQNSKVITEAALQWQKGDLESRSDVVWATSEYTNLMRHHFDMLRNLIYPLLEQSITAEDEQRLSARLNHLIFEDSGARPPEQYLKMIEALEEELDDWR